MSRQPVYCKPRLLCTLLCAAFPLSALAGTAEPEPADKQNSIEVELQQINVSGRRAVQDLGKEKVRRTKLDKELVHDIHDLVRYEPGISVSEGDRGNSNGFAIRGVDKDRVAITVDGLAQAESRSSEGFQELFGAYGNYNIGRNAAEIETIKEVTLQKGADSLSAGSGALGGAVMYQTKSPRDYVDEDKPFYAGIKGGYISKSRQKFSSMALGGYLKGFDALLVYTHRKGHETKNHSGGADYNTTYQSTNGTTALNGTLRAVPDEQNVKSKSTLLRLGYHFNPSNYLGWIYEDYRQDRVTDERSNLLSAYGNGVRYRFDVSYRKRTGLEYENRLENGPWDKLKINYDRQRVDMTTLTWDMDRVITRRNAEAFFRNRGLFQKSDHMSLTADKNFEFDKMPNFSWDMKYGVGHSKTKNTNDNNEHFVYVFEPSEPNGNPNRTEFLVSGQRKNTYGYWNNLFRFGTQWKLGLGARYDKITTGTLESDSLDPKVAGQLKAKGLWNQKAEFKAPSYAATLDWSPLDALTLQAKYSTGFRAPTTDEMWFFYEAPDVVLIEPNPKLKQEKAQNIDLGFNVKGSWGNVKVSGFRTKYKDFIYLSSYNAAQKYYDPKTGTYIPYPAGSRPAGLMYKNINVDNAFVKGVEIQGRWKLDSIGMPKGLYANWAGSYQKGYFTTDGNKYPLNALQPFSGLIGLGYEHPESRWGLALNNTYFARKNPKDTTAAYDRRDEVFPFAKHSRNIWVTDLIGHYKIGKNVTVRGGLFNLFNKKYLTWDSLRAIREFGAVGRVGNCGGAHATCSHPGIQRFTAPGRNYTLSIEATF
ncbi:TonB-dependent hemoglobin/transferrin/lactoferrin family receptor [Neisseria leonii]|uniref:TonB-dependent hemoglobin/transferrin/lactoferrin family receptor n=1 Tax=Neisseria leonii TaxID=2995413 RepID=UPI00237BA825|nr:TonB-dependent hemoglobin/transferrin/lactoferrin family receptor [Neisseria sp. 3986]MDD9326512.1 TonB-dependent hemoglobin/transferrin/lactoferrin family receptor [Neisseria sp. 3986]